MKKQFMTITAMAKDKETTGSMIPRRSANALYTLHMEID